MNKWSRAKGPFVGIGKIQSSSSSSNQANNKKIAGFYRQSFNFVAHFYEKNLHFIDFGSILGC